MTSNSSHPPFCLLTGYSQFKIGVGTQDWSFLICSFILRTALSVKREREPCGSFSTLEPEIEQFCKHVSYQLVEGYKLLTNMSNHNNMMWQATVANDTQTNSTSCLVNFEKELGEILIAVSDIPSKTLVLIAFVLLLSLHLIGLCLVLHRFINLIPPRQVQVLNLPRFHGYDE